MKDKILPQIPFNTLKQNASILWWKCRNCKIVFTNDDKIDLLLRQENKSLNNEKGESLFY